MGGWPIVKEFKHLYQNSKAKNRFVCVCWGVNSMIFPGYVALLVWAKLVFAIELGIVRGLNVLRSLFERIVNREAKVLSCPL